MIASGSVDKTVRLWDAQTGDLLHVIEGHESFVTSVAFSPDGRIIVSGIDHGGIFLWNVNTTHLLALLRCADYDMKVVFSLDGERIAAVGSNEIFILGIP